MRTLDELKTALSAIPSSFARDTSAKSAFKDAGDGETSYATGFPAAYSKDPNKDGADKGKWLIRNDMNALGEMATRELYFKEAGGVHTYDSDIEKPYEGYPEGAVLTSFDGSHMILVESQEKKNHKSFLTANKKTDYSVVNCKVKYQNENPNKKARVLWKSVSWIGGLNESLFHLKVNFSDIRQIKENETLEQDSLVIGTRVYFVVTPKPGLDGWIPRRYNITNSRPLEHDTIIDANTPILWVNKGRFGDAYASGLIITGLGIPRDVPMVSYTGGTGNYYFSFFAKKGTSVSTAMRRKGQPFAADQKPFWYAIPIIQEIREEEND